MAYYAGRKWTRSELLERVGQIKQIASVEPLVYDEGKAKGVKTFLFDNGSGLTFEVLADRCLDIGKAKFLGQSLSWISSVGVANPQYYDPQGTKWLRTFGGGLVATCGLTTAGAAGTDGSEALGLHGRIGNTPAEEISFGGTWRDDDYILWCEGLVRETEVFGAHLVLRRRVETRLGDPTIWIYDKVTNAGYARAPFMVLYHINLGFPLLSKTATLKLPPAATRPRDEIAARGMDEYTVFPDPVPGYQEQVFYHDFTGSQDAVTIEVENPALQGWKGLALRYRKNELPRFSEWKMVSQGEYVLGLEPANCRVEGRAKERQEGTLQFLAPGESWSTCLELTIVR